jgi:gliding motility-associated-like protein
MLKRSILIYVFLIFLFAEAFASHYMGGEITWQCLGNGNYRFVMKLYRECNGVTYGSTETISVAGCPSISSITMNLYPGGNPDDINDGTLDGKTDISPKCYTNPIMCNPSPATANTGAVEEYFFTSDLTYPTGVHITGVPPASGWVFSHTSCCRNPSTNVSGATSDSWFLRAVMYPFNGTDAFPCYDNSPSFAEVPSTVICTGYYFTYNHTAADKEMDSLVYSWAPALDGSLTTPVTYMPNYTFNNPLPGTVQNPANIPATINASTGEISYLSYTPGAFVTVTKVAAYRCNIKIAEVFREMQIVLLACPQPNDPPDVEAPFLNPVTGVYDTYVDTVYAGDVVDFDITALDFNNLPNGFPNTITVTSASQDYGNNYTSTTSGCVNPPCATLNPAPPFSAMVALATHFHWQTDCNHVVLDFGAQSGGGCAILRNIHTFFFKVHDNACPAYGVRGITVTIVVLPPPPIPAPRIHCTEVLPNGDVTLTWTIPEDPLHTYDSYHIFSSTSPTGPFTEIDSLTNYLQTSYTHVGAGANNNPVYYYVKSRSGCFGKFYSPSGDTVAAMHLDVTPIGGGQIAQLNWNAVHDPLLGSSAHSYQIYREYPLGTWSFVDSTTSLTYLDTVTVCNDSINYRIEIGDTLGCTSISSVDGALLQDGFPPLTPIMDTVSVNRLTGKVEMSWQASPSLDTRKYFVYRRTGGGPWFIIDSVFGINNTYYTYLSSNPQIQSESYCVAALDSCKQTSGMGLEHRTIFLKPLAVDACADKIKLNWNSYINMDPDVTGYRVWMSENGAPYVNLSDLPITDSTYNHVGFTENSNYCYYIQAYDSAGKFSSSNVQCVIATKPNEPQYVYFRYATVVDNQYAHLGFFVDTTAYISRYKILRSNDGVVYDELASVLATNVYSTVTYDDLTAFVNSQPYYYKVVVVDSCNLDALTSNVAKTIYLDGDANTFMTNHLDWTAYEDRNPQAYNIYREISNYDDLHAANTVQWGQISFDDDVAMYTETSGRFYYMIEAPLYDIFMQQYPFADTVYSNRIELLQQPRVYIPNAFTPDGLNPVFKPVGVFTDAQDFLMVIYNRWGQRLYTTTDVETGWDGYFDGKVCPMGSYVYYIRFRLPDGKYFERTGSVNLVR